MLVVELFECPEPYEDSPLGPSFTLTQGFQTWCPGHPTVHGVSHRRDLQGLPGPFGSLL